jgi:hypothetical protein
VEHNWRANSGVARQLLHPHELFMRLGRSQLALAVITIAGSALQLCIAQDKPLGVYGKVRYTGRNIDKRSCYDRDGRRLGVGAQKFLGVIDR